MRRVSELLVVVVLLFVAFSAGSCGTDRVQIERDQAYKLANHYRWQRDSTAAAQRKTDTITKVVIRADARLSAQNDSLMSVLTYADSVLRDSTASILDLRVTLGVTISRAAEFQASAMVYRDSVRTLIAAHAEERFAVNKTLIAADSAVNAWKRVADAERRKGWRRFTQGAFVGGIVTLALVLVL